jgi:hypothetical protein
MLIYGIGDKIISIIMSTEKNNDIVRKRQQDIDATENDENEETIETASYKTVKEPKKEVKVGDSNSE